MGIDYVIVSKINPNMYEENDPNKYLKYALIEIDWESILDLLRINLSILYDSAINYWTPEQVKDMYLMIKGINDDPYNLYISWKKEATHTHSP